MDPESRAPSEVRSGRPSWGHTTIMTSPAIAVGAIRLQARLVMRTFSASGYIKYPASRLLQGNVMKWYSGAVAQIPGYAGAALRPQTCQHNVPCRGLVAAT